MGGAFKFEQVNKELDNEVFEAGTGLDALETYEKGQAKSQAQPDVADSMFISDFNSLILHM